MQCPFVPDFPKASVLTSIKSTVAAHAQTAACLGNAQLRRLENRRKLDGKHLTVEHGNCRCVDSGLGEKGFLMGIAGLLKVQGFGVGLPPESYQRAQW
jgi:hypothetical protein